MGTRQHRDPEGGDTSPSGSAEGRMPTEPRSLTELRRQTDKESRETKVVRIPGRSPWT
jgi:hypothetical protein